MDPQPDASEPFSYEQLASLRAGGASADDEERLRMLMDRYPDTARQMLADLDAVEAEFPDPPGAHEPIGVPAHVAARWQSAIAREAERRAQGGDVRSDCEQSGETSPEPAASDVGVSAIGARDPRADDRYGDDSPGPA